MPRKPDRFRYGADDSPPLREAAALGIQHACLALVFLIYPVAVAAAAGLTPQQTISFLTASILGMALVAGLQQLKPPWGSASLAIFIPSPLMLPAAIQAGLTGGLAMISGLTLASGIFYLVMARLARYLRVLFPAEVCGVVLLMLGVSIASPALRNATGATFGSNGLLEGLDPRYVAVACGTLVGIVLVTVFGKGALKLFSLAVGLLVGVALSAMAGVFEGTAMDRLNATPWVGLPTLDLALPTLDLSLVPLVLVLAVFNSIDSIGVLTGIQRTVDADWRKVDAAQCAGGIHACGIGDVAGGILGAMPGGVSSANAGLLSATGTAARLVATFTAGMLLLAVFMPKVVALMMALPSPVVGGILVYISAHMMVGGMELVQSRMASERRMLTVGLSVLAGLAPLVLPGYWNLFPPLVAPIFKSSLAVAALVALVLNLVFRIGISQQASVAVARNRKGHWEIGEFLEQMGRVWGAPHDVVRRAKQAASEFMELANAIEGKGHVQVDASFDDLDLVLVLTYTGPLIDFPLRLGEGDDDFGENQDLSHFAGYIIRRLADSLTQASEGEKHRVVMRFEQ